mmetsp:Transcript_34156/g.75759  ORF Transcript_34156/g.75759 Transcript_34156/m.75759 type:complete len:777 (+) Transcript_34156:33-2363(+)
MVAMNSKIIGPMLPEADVLPNSKDSSAVRGEVKVSHFTSLFNPRWAMEQRACAGLQNLGNTCYCNSVLQCLAFLPPIGNLVRDPVGLHGVDCRRDPCMCCLVTQQLSLQLRARQALRPVQIISNLHLFSRSFQRGQQEDSHEFLHAVLDAVERDARKSMMSMGHKRGCRTLVEDMFQGHTISQVKCLECGHESNVYEPFATLSLDLGSRALSIEDSLRMFTAHEILEGANKYKCDKCARLVRARKQVALYDDPNVLVVHLKRFDASLLGAKISRHVRFGTQLDLSPFSAGALLGGMGKAGGLNGQSDRSHYKLSGVLVHQGSSVNSGHYFCYVCDSSGQWSCMNDSNVYFVHLDQVLSQQAYMLFYVRCSMKHPCLPPAPAPSPAPCTTPPSTSSTTSQSQILKRQASSEPSAVYGPQLPPSLRTQQATAAATTTTTTTTTSSDRTNVTHHAESMPAGRSAHGPLQPATASGSGASGTSVSTTRLGPPSARLPARPPSTGSGASISQIQHSETAQTTVTTMASSSTQLKPRTVALGPKTNGHISIRVKGPATPAASVLQGPHPSASASHLGTSAMPPAAISRPAAAKTDRQLSTDADHSGFRPGSRPSGADAGEDAGAGPLSVSGSGSGTLLSGRKRDRDVRDEEYFREQLQQGVYSSSEWRQGLAGLRSELMEQIRSSQYMQLVREHIEEAVGTPHSNDTAADGAAADGATSGHSTSHQEHLLQQILDSDSDLSKQLRKALRPVLSKVGKGSISKASDMLEQLMTGLLSKACGVL